jgi:predicted dehydrogenase
MTKKEIRVGIVGANAKKSWANASHVPAIKGLPGLKLAAAATRNGATVSGEALPVADPRLEIVGFYKVSNLKVAVRKVAEETPPPP